MKVINNSERRHSMQWTQFYLFLLFLFTQFTHLIYLKTEISLKNTHHNLLFPLFTHIEPTNNEGFPFAAAAATGLRAGGYPVLQNQFG